MPNAEIVSIGSELLLGQIVDTNSAWMAQRLNGLGIDLFHTSVVGDNRARMASAIRAARGRADIVVCGGGLGPTQDDLTREMVAEVTGRTLLRDTALVAEIKRMFRSRGIRMTANNERQGFIPEGATVLRNPNGTAPAFAIDDEDGVLCALPGVPLELKWLFDNALAPLLRGRYQLAETITYRLLKVVGLGESAIDDEIGDLIATSSNPTVGVLAHPGQVDVRIAAKAGSIAGAHALIEPVEREMRRRLGQHLFGMDEETLEEVVGTLVREQGLTVASHEDTTRGMLAGHLAAAAGDAFIEGVVAPVAGGVASGRAAGGVTEGGRLGGGGDAAEDTPSVAVRRAAASRARTGSDIGIAIHGVPAHDTRPGQREAENLRLGTTNVAVVVGERTVERRFGWSGTGTADRTRAARYALALLREVLLM